MRLHFTGMPQNKSAGFGKDLLTIMIHHYHMIGAVEREEVLIMRTNQPVDFTPITGGDYMIIDCGHNQYGDSYAR